MRTLNDRNDAIKANFTAKLTEYRIETSRFFTPSNDSIKVLYNSEEEINKTLDRFNDFQAARFKPRTSMELKAARTV